MNICVSKLMQEKKKNRNKSFLKIIIETNKKNILNLSASY
jgi:hypothetical protein